MNPDLPHVSGEALDATIDRCFAGLERCRALLLAVSGGPDSMALMHLAARWAQRRDHSPSLHVATIDHGLRAESKREAEMVASGAAGLALPHVTLDWSGPKPKTGIQEKARAARYALLASRAREIDATYILTAHHADDQAETVLLRLGRGSGIGGLAGMRRLSAVAPGLCLARPLLDVAKADLLAYCLQNEIAFIDDPSNHDPSYARARLRAEARDLSSIGLDTAALVRLASRMARADAALEAETYRIEGLLRPTRAAGIYKIDLSGSCDIAPEIALRLVRLAVRHVSADTPLRLDRLESLGVALWEALYRQQSYSATLAGTLLRLDDLGRLHVAPEPERRRGRSSTAKR